jgi:hypothetical protein
VAIEDRNPQQVTARGFILNTLTGNGGGFSFQGLLRRSKIAERIKAARLDRL